MFDYIIYHPDGTPVNPKGMYFVLKLAASESIDRRYTNAARQAALTFAENITEVNPSLAENIRALIADLDVASSPN